MSDLFQTLRKIFFAWQFFYKFFETTHIFIRIEKFLAQLNIIPDYKILGSNTKNHFYANFYLNFLI